MLHYIVDKFHVSTPDSEIEAEIRKRVKAARKRAKKDDIFISPDTEEEWVKEAIEIHHKNQGLYNAVMTGRF